MKASENITFPEIFNILSKRLRDGSTSKGAFAAYIFDFGKANLSSKSVQTCLDIVSENSWQKYANGNDQISNRVARAVLTGWDVVTCSSNFQNRYGDSELNDLAMLLHAKRPAVNKKNVCDVIAEILHSILLIANGTAIEDIQLEYGIEQTEVIEKQSIKVDRSTGKIYLGDALIDTIPLEDVPDKLSENELVYISQLIEAYSGIQGSFNREDIPDKFIKHFDEQRRCFNCAEWAKAVSWADIDDGELLYSRYLDEIEISLSEILLMEPDAISRLMESLKQVSKLPLDGVRLNEIQDLLDIWVRKGSCHQLVNLHRMSWSD